MDRNLLAIALCRVSSIEQLENNSLRHQKSNVLKAAEDLGVTIPADGIWEGQVSSKKGVNFNRKDLLQMVDYCKRHPQVKYLIVQEVDRFMRSPDEQTYWYVRFWYEVKVKVWFADKPELNEDTHVASLLRYMEGWRAGGSNEERINKSINGQTAALKEGRWTFCPKPGYVSGTERGIPEIHPVRGPALKDVLTKMVCHELEPTAALIELNRGCFMDGHSAYKMDKFRKIATDPFYAGVVEINKQVRVRNENGLHQPLITIKQHQELLRIFEGKQKTQVGPRKNGNPKYPGNNISICDECLDKRNKGRFVGFDHSNGKNKARVYESYRCRSCGKYLSRDELHNGIKQQFEDNPITEYGVNTLIKALGIVWGQKRSQEAQEIVRINNKIESLKKSIEQQVEAATDPTNTLIKEDIMASIAKKKDDVSSLEGELYKLQSNAEQDWEHFLRYAFNFVENFGSKFLEPSVSQENRLRCKQVVFPAGFYVNKNKKVYTPEKSYLITLLPSKKDASESDFSHLVRVKRL